MLLSPKQKDFLMYKTNVECLEGQTYGGKTTIGAIKFILRVKASRKMQHVISGLDLGTIEKNIITKEMGILDYYGEREVKYFSNGNMNSNLPHLEVNSLHGLKIVFLFGYADSARWKKVLGGQYGCGLIDECNTADMDLVRELAMRCDYIMMTLNPDNPTLPIYKEYINHCRPLEKYKNDEPESIMKQLLSEEAKEGWVHWYFKMDDNPILTPEKKQKIIDNVPKGTRTYKAKIEGIRAVMENAIVDIPDEKIISLDTALEMVKREGVYHIFIGCDSGISPGKDATAVTITLKTTLGHMVKLPSFERVPQIGSNTNSQVAQIIERWVDYWLNKFECFNLGIITFTGDSAALTQDLLYEISFMTKYDAFKVESKDILRDTQRIISIIGTPDYLYIVNDGCHDPDNPSVIINDYDPLLIELTNWVWDSKTSKPKDGNDHTIDAFKYESLYWQYY